MSPKTTFIVEEGRGEKMAFTGDTRPLPSSEEQGAIARRTYIIVGVVAAAVSAATAAYILRHRARGVSPHIESVQQLLDRCHDQVRSIESRLGELNAGASNRSIA